MDPHSHGNPAQVRVTHVSLDLAVDFDRKTLDGLAQRRLERTGAKAPLVVYCQGDMIESPQVD